ncbi:hypothetical protein D3C81_1518330 [compost metagenome]
MAASLTKVASPRRITAQSTPSAHAAATDDIAFSTWKPMLPLRVSGMSASAMRTWVSPSHATISPPSANTTRLPCARCSAIVGSPASCAKNVTVPGQASAMRATIGSAAFSTAMPCGATFWTITLLSTARSSTVLM